MKMCWNQNASLTWIYLFLLFKFSIHNSFFTIIFFPNFINFMKYEGSNAGCVKPETYLDFLDVRSLE